MFKRSTHPSSADHAGLLDLAPGGVYLANHVSMNTGGLLHHLFTIAHSNIVKKSCLLSVALSVPYYRDPPLQRRLILRSSDFPPLFISSGDHSPTSIIYSSTPSQNNIMLQLGQVIISILFFISITIWGGS